MKYLITQTQLEDIQAMLRWLCFGECRVTERAIPTSAQIIRMLESLKPIEPMTDDEIKQTVVRLSDELFGEDGDIGWTDSDTLFYGAFASAIEHHILGETS